ncbi:uncharacterized protein PGTG_06206 [Puccinia graminis f. sp. tritici CRL 75-36-700-3]|uniref:Uncharacterized protein n=1 Tax=Puccinia graminis f. sp. tritici (strain CRL 75-36-700-3 / race SCCL) TaxID=418459 RepID=E3K854_PUCGT|nr:uncharacterized protein PGTG_06206 [Puccinia graminis f. sp. tritici CRL 75-36-700-3]EFP80250.1 hypothetical protein PGTG_06206 [Puccinia graminis f. sp. tritici CRL 75-36-700-3]
MRSFLVIAIFLTLLQSSFARPLLDGQTESLKATTNRAEEEPVPSNILSDLTNVQAATSNALPGPVGAGKRAGIEIPTASNQLASTNSESEASPQVEGSGTSAAPAEFGDSEDAGGEQDGDFALPDGYNGQDEMPMPGILGVDGKPIPPAGYQAIKGPGASDLED